MPKVLRIINRFNLGGPTYNAAYLTKYLEPDFETILVGGEKDISEESSEYILEKLNIKSIVIPEMRRSINPLLDWKAYWKIVALIKEHKPDIVHTHAAKAGAIGRLAAINLKVPIILHTFHGHVFHSYFNRIITLTYKVIERYLAKRSSKIIAISELQKKELASDHKICNSDHIEVIPLGFDLTRFNEGKQEKRQTFRTFFNLDEDTIAIGIIGRLVPIKNHQLFLEAIKYITENTNKKIRAFIIGDGEDREKIKDQCIQLGLSYDCSSSLTEFDNKLNNSQLNSIEPNNSNIAFTSWIKNVDFAFNGLDIITLSSLNEGTPVSIIEAQAACKPIVTTPVGGVGNIVIPNKTALLSDGSSQSYCENLFNLVQNDNLRNEMGKEGWNFVENRYSHTRLASDMKKLYLNLIQST